MSKEKILIVDDEPLIRWALSESLYHWGYEPVEAATATEALAAFEQARPIAVLLDINLPDGSGLELLRSFKRLRPQTVVIMITAEVVVEHTISALRGDADDFIGKPINIDELHFALQDAIAARRHKREPLVQGRPRLLIVTDSSERLGYLSSALSTSRSEITSARSPEEVRRACQERHDLAIVDVTPEQLPEVLGIVRASAGHAEIPLLVAIGRIAADPAVTGVLPKYRAMPCGPAELVALARRRLTSLTERQAARQIL
ncbi:MAG TPA: response regulator [Blastocatellia bacterium]|nr:response regulator [Blastocatellia bacterium]